MIVAGVMSGTSLDGIDVAFVDIRPRKMELRIVPLCFRSIPYPAAVREALLGISNTMTHTAAISRVNFLLGELYAEAIEKASSGIKPDLIGLHGQTIFHEGAAIQYLGRQVASTFQIGEASVVAERTGVRVISNFRERDIAVGGQGAPLVPYVDYLLFGHKTKNRVALNIGGIANITILPAAATPQQVVAFDTGPGNMIIDALVQKHTGGKMQYDRNGSIARHGNVHTKLLEAMLGDTYFAIAPPKSTGRERYGREFVNGLLATGVAINDLIATATEFTARSIAQSIPKQTRKVIASGGGVHNKWLMRRLGDLLPEASITSSADFGIDPDAKEAVAFAILAYEFARGRCANLPSATGASRPVLLGKDSPVLASASRSRRVSSKISRM